MVTVLSAILVAGAVAWAGWQISQAVASRNAPANETARLMALFAPGIAAAAENPRALLAWQPLAVTARQLFPAEFAALDNAAGGRFPFTVEQIQAAHARWTAEWLAWERAHDAECKMKVIAVQHELGDAVSSAYGRARLDAVEGDKLDRYQRRYEEYTRVAKALQALVPKT